MPDGVKSDSVVFTSWKEIASYLGKGVRTVQRWESQFGLPVQRPNARAKGIVRATREELDLWIATRWSPRMEKPDIAEEMPALPTPVKGVLEAHHNLQAKNRALLHGIRQSIEQLASNCQNLIVSVGTNRQMRSGDSGDFLPPSEINEGQYPPPPPAPKQAKAD